MPRQANGQYQQPANTAAVSGETVGSAAFNTLTVDIGTELTNSLDRAGRSSMTAALPMGGNKVSGMADPAASTDAATKNYVDTATALLVSKANYQNAAQISATAAGSSDAITATFTPTITTLAAGMTVEVRAGSANTTTTPTFQADATTAYTIVKGNNLPLVVGDIAGAGHWLTLIYDATLTKWVLSNPANAVKFSFPVPAAFKNLVIKVASNTTVACSADFITVTDGTSYQTLAFSGTVNLGTAGVVNALDTGVIAIDSDYFIWAIAKADGTAGWLASLSSTAPTLPTGYTFKARMGTVKTVHATAQLYGTWQLGRNVQYVRGLAQTTTLPLLASTGVSIGTLTGTGMVASVVTGAGKPLSTLASRVRGFAAQYSGIVTYVIAGPNNSFGSYQSQTDPPPLVLYIAPVNVMMSQPFDWMLESNSIYWATSNSGYIFCTGWEENI